MKAFRAGITRQQLAEDTPQGRATNYKLQNISKSQNCDNGNIANYNLY